MEIDKLNNSYFLVKSNQMSYEAEKLELIRWLMDLEDKDAISYLQVVKESIDSNTDWWDTLPEAAKSGVMRGLDDIANNQVTPHGVIKEKYGI
jgi:hypothetical protein